MFNQEKILIAAGDLLKLINGEEVETIEKTITVKFPISIINFIQTIAEQVGIEDQIDTMLGTMVSKGLLTSLQEFLPMNIEEKINNNEEKQEITIDPETTEAFGVLSKTLEGLNEKLSKLEGMVGNIETISNTVGESTKNIK
jgi:hypothetical protein